MAAREDARMLAYERKATPSFPTQEVTAPAQRDRTVRPFSGQDSKKDPKILTFSYPDGESALKAAKKAIKGKPTYRYHRNILPDGTDCFEVLDSGSVIERHIVLREPIFKYDSYDHI